MTGASDPVVIELLRLRFPEGVRHLSDLHAKTIISTDTMIVGSANFSSSGLTNCPNGQDGWEEAGLMLTDKEQIVAAQRWFEQLWDRASPVLPRDIELATVAWNRNRDGRTVLSSARNLLDIPLHEFEERRIYVALWDEDASQAALDRFEEVKSGIVSQLSSANIGGVDFFQDADDYPEEAIIISAKILANERVEVDGAWTRVHQFDKTFSGRTKGTLQIVVKRKRILDRSFDVSTQRKLSRIIERYIESAKATKEPEFESRMIPLSRILQFRTDA